MTELDADIRTVLARHWGFDSLRPLQHAAVRSAVSGRDTLVVLPTGGGKSLCYQLPPLLVAPGAPALGVVVSPLIALMKDQVDALRLAGYPAAALHSGVTDAAAVRRALEEGHLRLLYVSPERLLKENFAADLSALMRRGGRGAPGFLAIDEAHCISQWGHDFRPEYRRLGGLRQLFPGVPVMACTATATPRVRQDILSELRMDDAEELVGDFDRPNLTYRVFPRLGDGHDQVAEILRRHDGEAAIVYCISRKQTEDLVDSLKKAGITAAAYHAGLDQRRRNEVQEAFIAEKLDVVVATVAFGMGIDRGDVRCVIHASLPKSVEAYQQETGRAGRDGMPAECVLLYAASDAVRWGQLMEKSALEAELAVSSEVLDAQRALLSAMRSFASSARCRHAALTAYFGQEYPPRAEGCGACDVCNHELVEVPDSTLVARKILSCVARLRGHRDMAYGAAYLVDVLRGAKQAKIIERGHHELSTFGILAEMPRDLLLGLVNQLVDLQALDREESNMPVLRLAPAAVPILKGTLPVRFLQAKVTASPSDRRRRRTDVGGREVAGLSPAELRLFEVLRVLRRRIAERLGVPPYVVFGDSTLEAMCRQRPRSLTRFAELKGVGAVKLEQFGAEFVATIVDGCEELGLSLEPEAGRAEPEASRSREPEPVSARANRASPSARTGTSAQAAPAKTSASVRDAVPYFERGESLDTVAAALGRVRSTTVGYLITWIELAKPRDISPWVEPAMYHRITDALDATGGDRLRPAFEHLGGEVDYDRIRLVASHRRALGEAR